MRRILFLITFVLATLSIAACDERISTPQPVQIQCVNEDEQPAPCPSRWE